MALETGTHISDLVTTNPTASDPKSAGDDHLRLVKSVLKNSFPAITGAVTMTHTQLNTVTARGLIAGQTWLGAHTFPATTYGITAAFGASGTAYATLDFVNTVALSAALPGQTGNVGKFLRTDGTTASFSELGIKGADIASAATLDLSSPDGDLRHATGTTTITGVTIPNGAERTVVFDGALTLTHGAALILPGAANIATAAGDMMTIRGDGANIGRVISYVRANGRAVKAGLALLATITPTAAAQLDALTAFGADFDSLLIVGAGLRLTGAATDQLVARFATAGAVDTAANYINVATNGAASSAATTSLSIGGNVASAGKGINFTLTVSGVNSATLLKSAFAEAVYEDSAAAFAATEAAAAYKAANTVSGIRFYWSTGATFVAGGSIRIYGISNS